MSAEPRPARRAWLFGLPVVIAVAALAWAFLHPSVVCTSGSDTIVCAEYSDAKFLFAAGGVGLALLVSGLLGFVVRLRHSTIATGLTAGFALVGLAVIAYVRAIT
jgi:hypothetical protein